MSDIVLAPPQTGKQTRRARIIHEAHKMIGREGFDGLSLRKLASAAEVTVPTIYNLIGSKEQILVELFRAWIAQIEAALDQIIEIQPLELAETIITEAIDLIREDEVFFRAAHLAINRLVEADSSREGFEKLGVKASSMQTAAVRAAQAQGLLNGTIPAETLGTLIYFNYSEASRYWMHGHYTLDDFRNTALTGVYVHFLSDASAAFRPELLNRLSQMAPPKI
ncbi:MAG: TetR/AcrR family transcriptional regulator [Henriciella sp.]